jgi:hypothetical protein
LLCSVKVKWDEKASGKSYNSFLLKLIFKKFGVIRKMTEDERSGPGLKKKVYLEFAEFDSATAAVVEFRGKEESLKVKFLMKDRRDEYQKQILNPNFGTYSLTSENLNKIMSAHNGVSYETRNQEMRREAQRQKLVSEMLEAEKAKVMAQFASKK